MGLQNIKLPQNQRMEMVLHEGFKYEKVPENYVFPLEAPHRKLTSNKSISIIDLAGSMTNHVLDHDEIVKKFLRLAKNTIINHGVHNEVLGEILEVMKEFFDMPFEDRAIHYSEDLYKPVRLFTSIGVHDIVRSWRDCLRMAIYPIENMKQYWPEKPKNLKKIVERYAIEMKGLSTMILGLITEGLGLEYDYFNGDLSGESMVSHVNFYPQCPDPNLTFGLVKHCDPGLITFLLQGDISGLEILWNGEWQAVDPIPNAIIVIFGHQMEFVSNRQLKAVEHCAITNDMQSRISIATFIQPTKECLVSPAKKLLGEKNQLLYKSFQFGDYFANFVANMGDKLKSTEPYLINIP